MIMLRKARVGLGVASLGMALSLIPAVAGSAPASASVHTSKLCTIYKADLNGAGSKVTAAVTRAVESGNWKVAQKALLNAFRTESGSEKSLVAALSNAPGSVKAAAGVALKFNSTLKSIISGSSSLTQYESKVTSASKTPKLTAAEKTLDTYTLKQCPGIVSTTPTT
jgi:hypothetical protein